MANRFLIAVASLCAVVCIGAAGATVWNHYTRPRIDVSKYIAPHERVELMHADTREWLEVHQPRQPGAEYASVVYFRDGNRGLRFFRADNTLREMIVRSPHGVVLAHLFFSPRGKMVVSGFEKRNDGTLRLDVRQNGKMVETRRFWQDGITLFSLEKREVDDFRHVIEFFHVNGARWAQQKGSLLGTPVQESLFDTSDRLVRYYEHDDVDRYTGIVRYVRTDGTTRLLQRYEPYERTVGTPEGVYEVKQRGLRFVDEFDEQDRLVRRTTMVEGENKVEFVELFDPQTGGQLAHIPFDPSQPAPIALPAEVTDTDIKPADPMKSWEEAEAKISASVTK